MFFKSPKFFYSFFLGISLFGLFIIFDSDKNKEINQYLLANRKDINYKYEELLKKYFQFGDLIYYNEIIRDRKILNILKNQYKKDIKKDIFENSVNSFSFYSNLELSNFGFYDANKSLILNFNEQLSSKKELLSKQDTFSFIKDENKIYLVLLKPIFDENLNFLGVLSLEFLFDDFLQKLQKELNQNFSYEISKNKFDDFTYKNTYINIFAMKNDESLFLVSENNQIKIDSINELFQKYFYISSIFLAIIIFSIYKFFDYRDKTEVLIKDYEEFFDYINGHILRLDTDINGNISYVSKAFCKLSGYFKEEILGKNVSILRHHDLSNTFYKNIWLELKSKGFWQGELKNRDKFGNTYWINTIIFSQRNLKGELVGFRSIRFDISPVKQLEKINRLLKEDLSNKLNKLKLKEKTDFDGMKVELMTKIVDSMSHLWKEPISKISTQLQKIDDENTKNLISKELFSLSNMLNEFKSIFKHKAEKTNLIETLDDIKSSFDEDIQNNNIKVKFSKDLNINLDISKNELRNILINVLKTQLACLNNFSNENEISVYISVLSEDNDDEITIKIEDNIKKDESNGDFEELLNSKDEEFFSTSIYLAKLLIEKNSGLFWYKSSVDETIYYIKLKKDLI